MTNILQINTNGYPSNVYPASQPSVPSKNSSIFAVDTAGTASKDLSRDIWTKLGSKYNVRYATFDELCEIAITLYKEGAISAGDCAMMTFYGKRAADDLRKDYPDVIADFKLTPADSEGRRDWIAEFAARAKLAFSQGNDKGYIQYQRLADILRKIDQSKPYGY
ncbi:MAG TPA: hypothetical protein PKW25_06475 [Syntrophomonadaceae bacterium]|nr:hypothetical protein [Syntrophomonadaceae bacterium]